MLVIFVPSADYSIQVAATCSSSRVHGAKSVSQRLGMFWVFLKGTCHPNLFAEFPKVSESFFDK